MTLRGSPAHGPFPPKGTFSIVWMEKKTVVGILNLFKCS